MNVFGMNHKKNNTGQPPPGDPLHEKSYFDNAPVAIYVTDIKGNIIDYNQKFSELTGISADCGLPVNFGDFIHNQDVAFVEKEKKNKQTERKGWDLEYRIINKDITTWVKDISNAVTNENDVITSFCGSLTDITEKKMKETGCTKNIEKYKEILKA